MKMKKVLWAIPIVLVAGWLVLESGYDRGEWVCSMCGKFERRKEVHGIVLSRYEVPSRYHEWWSKNLARDHDHDRLRSGCSRLGLWVIGALACSPTYGQNRLFESLPELQDRESARRGALKLMELPSEERRRELENFMRARWHDPRLPSREYREWWAQHPLWHDVFPPPVPEEERSPDR